MSHRVGGCCGAMRVRRCRMRRRGSKFRRRRCGRECRAVRPTPPRSGVCDFPACHLGRADRGRLRSSRDDPHLARGRDRRKPCPHGDCGLSDDLHAHSAQWAMDGAVRPGNAGRNSGTGLSTCVVSAWRLIPSRETYAGKRGDAPAAGRSVHRTGQRGVLGILARGHRRFRRPRFDRGPVAERRACG